MNNEKPLILTVDCNRRNTELMSQLLIKQGYQTQGATSLEEFDQALTDDSAKIKLVLLDISGFERSIWERCQQLRDREIPFLVISPKQSIAIQQESLAQGARSMLVKPLIVKQLLIFIQSLLGE